MRGGAVARPNERSRRAKLDSIPRDYLVQVAREALLFPSSRGRRIDPAALFALVASAAERGNDEAVWLQNLLSQHSSKPDDWFEKASVRFRWLLETVKYDDSLRGRYYRAMALRRDNPALRTTLLRQLCDEGFGPALCALAVSAAPRDPAESRAQAEEAAKLNDANGLALLGDLVEDAELKMSLTAARRRWGACGG